MSIYLEFPTIAEYPLYNYPYMNDQQLFFPERVVDQEKETERKELQDYIYLRTV